jgi:mono/diheme cytochrome c family protein
MSVSRLAAAGALLVLTLAVMVGAPAGAGAQEEGAARAAVGDVERGRYLVERVAMCVECHSARDVAGNIVPEMRFMGGPMIVTAPRTLDFPLYIPRIAGLPGYDDAQAMRLLTEGAIKRDGTQLRPPMPRFRLTPQDAAAVIAYLRSL